MSCYGREHLIGTAVQNSPIAQNPKYKRRQGAWSKPIIPVRPTNQLVSVVPPNREHFRVLRHYSSRPFQEFSDYDTRKKERKKGRHHIIYPIATRNLTIYRVRSDEFVSTAISILPPPSTPKPRLNHIMQKGFTEFSFHASPIVRFFLGRGVVVGLWIPPR